MRHLHRVSINELRETYDLIVGWGNSPLELARRVTALDIRLDYIINGEKLGIGKVICGATIVPPEYFMEMREKRILFVIFTNLETLLLRQITQLYPEADTIVSRLVDIPEAYRGHTYARGFEDVILLDLVKRLHFPKDFPYMDIGVCHPVVRNNTYLFYESGYTKGVLVEPNPEMLDLAADYRPLNKRINAGAGTEEGMLHYVRTRNGGKAGLNHFKREGEIVDTEEFVIDELPVYEINDILENMCDETPWVLDIDCEQMDLEILRHMDLEKFPIKIICAERDKDRQMYALLAERGYVHFADTQENLIYIRKDVFELL